MTSAHHHDHAHGPIEYRFCPRCGGGLEKRSIKAIEPKRLVCQTCSFIFYQDPKVVAGAIFTLNGGVVLLKRGVDPGMGKWVFPGGYVDRGETVEEAALRETREESQLEIVIGSLLNVYSYPRSPNIIIVYAARIAGGNLAAGDESVEAATFVPGDIPWDNLAFDSTRDGLKEYIRLYMKV
jgi:ADP-ribose pyrophosphatase YjhB (NUDIX family)